MKRGKKYSESMARVDRTREYPLEEAVEVVAAAAEVKVEVVAGVAGIPTPPMIVRGGI